MDKKRIIVFSPHPDDETLGCGGTIAKKIAAGYEVLIVIMTDGRFLLLSGCGIDSDPTPEEVKEIRKGEVLRAVKILGVPKNNVIFLDFIDGTLQENEKIAEEKVAEILSRFPPTEVYYPFNRDVHPDHRATNRIVERAIKKLGINPKMYQYIIMHKFARFGPYIETFLSIFKRSRVHVDVANFLPFKERATQEFKSELTTISRRQSEPRTKNFNKYLKKKEVFYKKSN